MGGTIIEENGYNNITEIDYNTTTAIPQLEVTRAHGNVITHVDHIPLSDSFVQAQKDGDNIKLTSITGVETSIGPFSGSGTSSTTNYPTSALTSNLIAQSRTSVFFAFNFIYIKIYFLEDDKCTPSGLETTNTIYPLSKSAL